MDLLKQNEASGRNKKDLLKVNHPQDIAKQLNIGQRAHINYTEAALTVIGFESEKQYLKDESDEEEKV